MSVLVGTAKKAGHPSLAPPYSPAEDPEVSSSLAVTTAGDQQSSSQQGLLSRDRSSRREEKGISRVASLSSICDSEDEENHEHEGMNGSGLDKTSFVVSPMVPLKEQLEKDKDDESLQRWKEQLLGTVLLDPFEEGMEPEVQVHRFSIVPSGRPEIVISLPLPNNKGPLFTLKEGSTYKVKFTFTVQRNIVSGLKYAHTVWKNGFKVDNTKVMLGTFGPQLEPYTYVTDEETTPSGLLARGSYTSRTKFMDDDGRCHLEILHIFDIRKDW